MLTFPQALVSQRPTSACPVAASVPPLPRDSAYRARYADPRINYSTTDDEQFLCRWHLERKEPTAALSDVIQPILYVVDAPSKWLPTIIDGITAWEPVFERIGFRHVLTVRPIAPADSVLRDHVVRITMTPTWGNGPITNCVARSAWGDLASCNVAIPQTLAQADGQHWCRIWAGADPIVPLPCPDSVLALLIKGIVTHEVGHTFGLDHNYNAGRAYPTDSLRSPTFVHQWGWTPSVMLHRGYDEVLQPEDRIPMRERWLQIGPQDYWAIAWGYQPIPTATTFEAEQPTLEQWRAAQDTASYLRLAVADVYGSEGDEGADSWGGDDVLKATTLWFPSMARLLDRVMQPKYAPGQKSSESNAPVAYTALEREALDSSVAAQWRWRMLNVVGLIGGRVAQPPYPGTPQDTLHTLPLPVSRQLAALRMVLASALYGQDAVMQWQRAALRDLRTAAEPSSDSTPLVFDSAATSHSRPLAIWQSAQHDVLEHLVQQLSALSPEAQLEACRDLSAAMRHITQLASATTGPQKSAVADVQRMFANLPDALVSCR